MTTPDYKTKDARINSLRAAMGRAIGKARDVKPNHAGRDIRRGLEEALREDDKYKES